MGIRRKIFEFQRDNITLPMDRAPVLRKIFAFIYKLLGRKNVVKLMLSSSRCDSCGRCVRACPNRAIAKRLNSYIRNRRCKGCMVCVAQCPRSAFEIPLFRIFVAIALLFLPFDDWLIRLFSIPVDPGAKDPVNLLLSLLIWSVGYATAVFLADRIMVLLSAIPLVKKIGEIPAVRKLRDMVHPATIYPVIIPVNPSSRSDRP